MRASHVKGYELIAQIGQGAASEIWRARQLSSGIECAVKIVHRGPGVDGRYFRQMENEYRNAGRFNHPNLVKMYELVRSRLLWWTLHLAVVEEFVEGVNLADLVKKEKLDARRLVEIYRQLAEGLLYMHSMGIVHLDMKPHNVIVTATGQAKIVDFGLCMPKGQYNPRVQGTPDFMAPEQMSRGWVDERTDVYNLGATMYHLITGKSVQMTLTSRNGNGNGHGTVASQTFRSLEVEVPEELDSLILASCRPRPSERPLSMAAVLTQLTGISRRMKESPVQS